NWDSDVGNYLFRHQLVHMGDANCDGRVNSYDIDPFILLIGDPDSYHARWPDCDADTFCDMNGDGNVNAYDIDGFVAAVGGG
ncbi:MAG: dockerin type I domain-containing protein, partial [Planctomycetota bacterium]